MRERKQNSVTFCFDSIAGKMAHASTKKNHVFFLIYKHADNCETTLIKKGKYILSFRVRKEVDGETVFLK